MDLVRRHFEELFNRKSLDACDDLMAEDYVEHAVAPFGQSEPGRVNGPQHMRGVVAWLLGQFPDLKFTVEAMVAEGDVVAARLLGEGTNLGPITGGPVTIPPTGKRFASRSSHWFRIDDGKLAEQWATRDDLTAMLQMGLVRPAGGSPAGVGP